MSLVEALTRLGLALLAVYLVIAVVQFAGQQQVAHRLWVWVKTGSWKTL